MTTCIGLSCPDHASQCTTVLSLSGLRVRDVPGRTCTCSEVQRRTNTPIIFNNDRQLRRPPILTASATSSLMSAAAYWSRRRRRRLPARTAFVMSLGVIPLARRSDREWMTTAYVCSARSRTVISRCFIPGVLAMARGSLGPISTFGGEFVFTRASAEQVSYPVAPHHCSQLLKAQDFGALRQPHLGAGPVL